MRKANLNKKGALVAVFFGVGILVQACGSGSGGSGAAVAGSTASCIPQANGTCTAVAASTTNAALYNACAEQIQIASERTGYEVTAATYAASPDGTETCAVSFEQSISFSGSRLFLGPSYQQYGLGYALTTPVSVGPYDELAVQVSGAESSSDGICNPSNSISTIAYGWISGVNYFLLSGATQSNPVVVPVNAGGQLYVGLNQSYGGGCMEMSGYATITRCVDSSGTPHQCPAVL